MTRRVVGDLRPSGQPLGFVEVAGGDHVTIATRTAATIIEWLGDRFAGRPAPNDCERL